MPRAERPRKGLPMFANLPSPGNHYIEVSASTKTVVEALCSALQLTPDQLITRLMKSLTLVAQEPPDPPAPGGGDDEDTSIIYDPTVPPSNPPITIEAPDLPFITDTPYPLYG